MVRLGVIGGGIMGERLLRAAQGHARVAVSGVWDPSPAATARLGEALPGVAALPSASAVIASCECVYVASPPGTHLGHARAALALGRAVFCEKPLATDLADARRFVAEARGARVAVNFPFVSSEGVAQLMAWVRAGTPERAEVRLGFRQWPRPWQSAASAWLDARAEGGFTREVASHFLFLAGRLLGPLELLSGRADFPEAGRSERAVRAELRAGGVPLTLTGAVGETAADDENRFEVHGPWGAVRLRDWAVAERRGADGAWVPEGDAVANERARPLVLSRQLDRVARLCAGEPHGLATAEEALAVQEVVEAVLGGVVVG